jgi:8-oxo-dGTP diphosphatase
MVSLGQLGKILGISRSRASPLVNAGRERGSQSMTELGTEPELLPVAAAIVVTDDGVLIEQRHDKIPPWTFPASEILPGQSVRETVERRVPVETGISVAFVRLLGRRIHPRTGRTMAYALAEVTGGQVTVGDPGDLADVKWATVEETRELMPDMFPPVRAYLDSLSK